MVKQRKKLDPANRTNLIRALKADVNKARVNRQAGERLRTARDRNGKGAALHSG